jgi:hypothetical protein
MGGEIKNVSIEFECLVYLDFRLNFTQFPSGQDLDVRTDLFSRPRLARPQLDVTGNEFVATCQSDGEWHILIVWTIGILKKKQVGGLLAKKKK